MAAYTNSFFYVFFRLCLRRTYQIRALPTIASDNIFCTLLAHSAVHGAYAGLTGFSVGPINGRNAFVPIDMLAGIQKKVDTSDRMWQRLVASTGQPEWTLPVQKDWQS